MLSSIEEQLFSDGKFSDASVGKQCSVSTKIVADRTIKTFNEYVVKRRIILHIPNASGLSK